MTRGLGVCSALGEARREEIRYAGRVRGDASGRGRPAAKRSPPAVRDRRRLVEECGPSPASQACSSQVVARYGAGQTCVGCGTPLGAVASPMNSAADPGCFPPQIELRLAEYMRRGACEPVDVR